MCTYLKNMERKKLKDLKNKSFYSIQKMFNRVFKRVNTFVDFKTDLVEGSSKRAGEELEQENEEEVAIDVVPLAAKSPKIVSWKIHKEGKNSYYQIMRANGKSQMYMIFSHMLKSFDREDLEDLYKLVKPRYGSTRLVEDLDLVLWNDLKNMFEPHVEDTAWRNQQGYKVLEWKLNLMILKKNIKFRGGLLGLKAFLMLFGVTAALIDVNAAQSKLVLLENFNKIYSKCLRLLYKVNAVEGVNAASEEVSNPELVRIRYIKVESTRQKGVCYNCGIEGHFVSECRKPKENKDFVRGAWSDSEGGDEPQNVATCLMAIGS
ncbi:putative ribonuclease H-like domain-containing protein [Tanacetum coccineum]